jgi:hypothetical protein
VDPYVDFTQGADSVRARSVTARMIANAEGLCIDSLSAQAETDVPARLAGAGLTTWVKGRATVPLVLQDRYRSGRRWGSAVCDSEVSAGRIAKMKRVCRFG